MALRDPRSHRLMNWEKLWNETCLRDGGADINLDKLAEPDRPWKHLHNWFSTPYNQP